MYYSGLAIRDAVALRKDAVNNGKLFLRRTKTETDVLCPLPGEVLKVLKAIGSKTEYYFWSGKSKPRPQSVIISVRWHLCLKTPKLPGSSPIYSAIPASQTG
jgi:hypothetical protein